MTKRRGIQKWIIVNLIIFMLMPISYAFIGISREGIKDEQNHAEELQTIEKLSLKNREPLWGVSGILIHVNEIFGTLDNPQYRPLSNVKVRIRSSLSEYGGLYLFPFRKGQTDDDGYYGELWRGLFFYPGSNLIIIFKEGYHTYASKPYQICRTPGGYFQDIYFTMTKNGSPFTKQVYYI